MGIIKKTGPKQRTDPEILDLATDLATEEIEAGAEGLLNDTGVDEEAARNVAKAIVGNLVLHGLLIKKKGAEKFFLIVNQGDVDPLVSGPYRTPEERDEAARNHRRKDPGQDDGLFPLDISANGHPMIGVYSGGFLDGTEGE